MYGFAVFNYSAIKSYQLNANLYHSVVLFAFLFNSVRCPCNVFDVIVSP